MSGTCRTIVLGGGGNFGARIVRALADEPAIELIIAGRRIGQTAPIAGVRQEVLDIAAADFSQRLAALAPQLVIHCVGPFQAQSYTVASAALGAGAHYLDLADARQFVAAFPGALHSAAVRADRVAICGASTLPALSTAVVENLRQGLQEVQSIEIAIAPGQRAPRGHATLAAVFSYLGRPYPIWRRGRWERAWGWMDLRVIPFDCGSRWAACCDVPDLALLPGHFQVTRTVTFHAALEFGMQHLALWSLAALRRLGLPLPVTRWALGLNRWAHLFDSRAGDKGGMWVRIVGRHADGRRLQCTWQLTVPALNGPEIPCFPAILLARRFARGGTARPGAYACIDFLQLADFADEFAKWGITTRTQEASA